MNLYETFNNKHLSLGCFFFFSLIKSLVCSFQYTVHHLNITNRGDCCYERLSNFEIRIGNLQADNTDQNPKCGGYNYQSLGAGETRKIVCPAQMKGRYVVIRIPGNDKTLTRAVAKGCGLGGVLKAELPSKNNLICRLFFQSEKYLLISTLYEFMVVSCIYRTES